jgi:DNA-binding transcriptional LysR family regulator
LKVQHIQTLVAIANAGSLRGAAEALGKSQPALTKSLRQAEDDLGVPIFQRSSRGVVPTELGERVLTRARAISSEIDRLDDDVAQLRGEQVGSIHVCVSPLAAVKIMPQALARFHAKFPKIEIHLTSGLFPSALKPLRDGRTDIVIGPTPPAGMAREISVEPLLKTPIVLITSKTSSYQKAKKLADLTDANWIMIGAPLGPGDIFRKPFVDHGLVPPKATTTSESYFGAMSLVEELGAVCTFPMRLLEDVRQGWDVDQIQIEETLDPLEISLMTRSGHPLTPMAEELVNALRRRVATLNHEYNQ